MGLLLASALSAGQTPQKPPAKKAATHRANELTLAGLRPGRDALGRAIRLNAQFKRETKTPESQTEWFDICRDISLTVDTGPDDHIQVVRARPWSGSTADCSKMPLGPWKTGLGLRLGDRTSRLLELYGEPDSKSPSTQNGQPLELWYYAFDWAGPDVPQVMEVLSTREKDRQPGRVVEITLAAASL